MATLGRMKRSLLASVLVAVVHFSNAQAQIQVLKPNVVYQPKYDARPVASPVTGRLVIVIRQASNPAEPVHGARVLLLKASNPRPESSILQRLTPPSGVLELDSIAVGKVVIRTLAIGFGPADLKISVLAGCVTFVEIYLMDVPFCLYECPRTLARATITTCRSDA